MDMLNCHDRPLSESLAPNERLLLSSRLPQTEKAEPATPPLPRLTPRREVKHGALFSRVRKRMRDATTVRRPEPGFCEFLPYMPMRNFGANCVTGQKKSVPSPREAASAAKPGRSTGHRNVPGVLLAVRRAL